MDREEQIRQRAHQLWEQEGRPEGREAEHWEQAAREFDADAPSHGDAVGLSTSLQPGGTVPGGGPGASEGSIGTGGGSTAGRSSGNR